MKRSALIFCGCLLVCFGLFAQKDDFVNSVRKAAWAKDVAACERLVSDYRAGNPDLTPRLLEAVSWAARGASFAQDWEKASKWANEVLEGSDKLLASRKLDADKSLPIALGAAIEVVAAMDQAKGDRAAALEFLQAEKEKYAGTSIEMRLQKNILLLSLEGKPAPSIDVSEWIGDNKPKAIEEMKGQPVLLFFWAHWCPDCKRERPIIEQMEARYAGRGLAIVGPTQYYGFVGKGQQATRDEELAYVKGPWKAQYGIPQWMPVPVSNDTFLKFGVSTVPTLMLVDRQGIVRLYHPGFIPQEELEAKIEPLLGMASTAAADKEAAGRLAAAGARQ